MDDKYHRQHLAVEQGDLIWFADKDTDPEVDWCLSLGLKVFVIGRGFITQSGTYQTGSSGDYSNKVGDNGNIVASGTYCCTPDLSYGWNTGATYYVTYSSSDSDTIGMPGDLIYEDAPDDWYDYGNKKWANIVTVSNGMMSYWTWVPRYMVKIVSNNISPINGTDDTADVKFVNLQNEWTGSDGSTMNSAELATQGYVLPDAFKFNGKELKGIWVAKYEISSPADVVGFSVKSAENSITITSLTYSEGTFSTIAEDDIRQSKLDVYVDGSIYSYTEADGSVTSGKDVTIGNNGFTIKGLSSDKEYTIKIIVKSKIMEELNLEATKKVKTTKGGLKSDPNTEAGETDIVKPDLTGFSKDHTYYATINNSNQIVKGSSIKEAAPSDWYDYENKKWANIMTLNESSDKDLNGQMAVWVWIPRYEFKVDTTLNSVDTVFIPETQTKADSGYQIPDAFKFNGKQLSGIWVAKYEISDPRIPSGFTTKALGGGFEISNIVYSGGSSGSSEVQRRNSLLDRPFKWKQVF